MPATMTRETDVPATERLYKIFRPRHYDLKLEINPDRDDFSARALIELELTQPARSVVLHAIDIAISEATVNGKRLDGSRIQTRPQDETVVIELDGELPAGTAQLELAYSAPFNLQMRGLYLAKARWEGKEERHAYTQFESTDARRMFPCIDEPEAKATFDVTVTAPDRWTVLSNTPVQKHDVSGGQQTVSFKTTPKMSPYLLAIAIGRLKSRSTKVGKTGVSVWAMPHELRQAGFALDTAKFVLAWLNRYFDYPYPLEKLDLVVVPEFNAGAMENWGLITFRDSAMLADPKLSSARAFRRVAEVVAHEIVHQWFGNLVTMEWWNDLWLNESFATWLAYKAVDAWKPGWRVWRDFEEGKASALPVDALKNTRPISSQVRSIADISAQFDRLTYEKGGAVLRMIESYLGEEAFRAGVRIYMRRHQYGNTQAQDLWRALEEASHEPIVRLAEDWLTRSGFPSISVSKVSDDGRKLRLSQRRFSAYGAGEDSDPWIVPIILKYKLAGEKKVRIQRVLLKEGEAVVELAGRGKLSWVYPNAGETGFYRVALDKELFEFLLPNMKTALDPIERSGFLGHVSALVRNGSFELRRFIDALRAVRGEMDWIVLGNIGSGLIGLHERVAASDAERTALKRLGLEIAGPAAKKLGWAALKDDDKRLARAEVLGILAYLSPDAAFIKKAEGQLGRYLKRPASVDSALASVLLHLGARIGDAKRHSEYEQRLGEASTPEQKDHLLVAIAGFRALDLARKTLDLALSDRVLGQDMWKPLGHELREPAVQAQAWAFVQEHWAEIRRKAGETGARRVIESLAGFWDLGIRREAEAFFNKPSNRVPSADRSLRQTLEFMELGAAFRERAKQELPKFVQ